MRGLNFLYKAENTYEYDGNNYRVFKQTPTEKTYYNYDGSGNLRFERRGRTEINYIYDAGRIRGMKVTVPTDDPSTYYASSEFYYVKDSLGNIRVILDKSGNIMVEYNYDAWGNFVAEKVRAASIGSVTVDLVSLNAFTYRGYYYDKESGLYYLINRYYDPVTGRFISPDDVGYLDFESFFGTNRYAYCLDQRYEQVNPSISIIELLQEKIENRFIFISSCATDKSIYNTVLASGSFRNGLLFGQGTITAFYTNGNLRNQLSLKSWKNDFGLMGKFSYLNASGKIGIGNDDFSVSLIGICDIGTATAMFGYVDEQKEGRTLFGVDGKMAVFTARAGVQFKIHNYQLEIGASVSALSIGFQEGFGIDGDTYYYTKGRHKLFGWDFYIKVKLY